MVAGMTQLGYYSRPYYPVYEPGTYLNSSYFGNLGFAFPVALGAKVAQPDKVVVAVSGDGGFLYNSQELSTAVQIRHQRGNGCLQRQRLRQRFARSDEPFRWSRTVGAELHNPDFVKLAEAYGARGVRVGGADELERALVDSFAVQAPTLIEVPVGMMPSPFA